VAGKKRKARKIKIDKIYLGKIDAINPNPNAIFSSPQVPILFPIKFPNKKKKKENLNLPPEPLKTRETRRTHSRSIELSTAVPFTLSRYPYS